MDISLTPTLKATGCSVYSLFANHDQTQWQIIRDADGVCILDSVSSNNLDQLDTPAALLEGKSSYSWRSRFLYTSGAQSKWSPYSHFTTAAGGPNQPIGVLPMDGAIDEFLTPVLQSSDYKNDDIEDKHERTQWQILRDSDNRCVYDITSADHLYALDVPPLVLEENTLYKWVARYYGAKGTLSDWSLPSRFTTGESGLDDDGNGVPDEQEVGLSVDLDNNGVADAQQSDIRGVNVLNGPGQMAVCAPADSGVARIAAIESTELAAIGTEDPIPFDMPLGLVSFRLEMDQVGGIARIKVHFSEPAPQAAKWIKFDIANGWQDYSAHAVFAHDRLSAEIEIQDGGFGDADGVENGVIIDPSGFGVATGVTPSEVDSQSLPGTASSASSGGGGGCFISTLWD